MGGLTSHSSLPQENNNQESEGHHEDDKRSAGESFDVLWQGRSQRYSLRLRAHGYSVHTGRAVGGSRRYEAVI